MATPLFATGSKATAPRSIPQIPPPAQPPRAAPDIHLAEGGGIRVAHREFLAISPCGRTAIVYQPDDSFNVIDLLLVTDLEVKPDGRSEESRRPGHEWSSVMVNPVACVMAGVFT